MNRVIKSNGFRGAEHNSTHLLGCNAKALKHLRDVVSIPTKKTKKFFAPELMGWFMCEIYLTMCEVAYILHQIRGVR